MKRIDFFCSSPASTAVLTSSVDHRSLLRRSKSTKLHVPCSSSQFPINPKPYFEKHRKSTSSAENYKKQQNSETRRKSSVEVSDLYDQYPVATDSSSRRYLLGDAPFIDWVSAESKNVTTMVPSQNGAKAKPKPMDLIRNDSSAALSRSSSSAHSKDQVVVLRVSLHCKACEGKVRKHISKMEGVRSFSIDMVTKKVTIIGDVNPQGVVESVSKVKKAQLWQSPTSSSYLWSA